MIWSRWAEMPGVACPAVRTWRIAGPVERAGDPRDRSVVVYSGQSPYSLVTPAGVSAAM